MVKKFALRYSRKVSVLELMTFKQQFHDVFNNPERRSILFLTVTVALLITIFLSFDTNRLYRLFYRPEMSIGGNLVNFVGVMCGCFVFGMLFSRLVLWIRSETTEKTTNTAQQMLLFISIF
jgi:hypothetical protein